MMHLTSYTGKGQESHEKVPHIYDEAIICLEKSILTQQINPMEESDTKD